MTSVAPASIRSAALAPALTAALRRIPPLWPLKHFVAVNPFVGLADRPFNEACALLRRTTGAAPLLEPATYLALYRAGEITDSDLSATGSDSARLTAALAALPADDADPTLQTIADQLDRRLPHAHWALFVTEEVSKFCATYFDENQTTWRSPWLGRGLFAAWREAARHDRNPEAFGLRDFRATVAALRPKGRPAGISTDDIADPVGEGLEVYAKTADRLDALCAATAALLLPDGAHGEIVDIDPLNKP